VPAERRSPADPAGAGDTRYDHDLLADYQRRTFELAALYETAGDLTALRDVDQVLAAIVRRGRQLLASDVAYLMLLDEERGEAYMRVTEGTLTPEFLSIRLAFGHGLGGLVADTGMPQWTSDYHGDPRFAASLDRIIRDEGIKGILGVPLKIAGRVTGVLFASDRSHREFTPGDVALLSSLASHAAIALENAALFEESRRALGELRQANARIEEHSRDLERAADLHEKLTQLVLTGAPLTALADAVAEAVGDQVLVLDPDGHPMTPVDSVRAPGAAPVEELVARALAEEPSGVGSATSGGSWEVELEGEQAGIAARVAPARAGARRLGYMVHLGRPLPATDVRSLERAALVTALLLLDRRAHEEAHARAMDELLADLVSAVRQPGRLDGRVLEDRIRDRARRSGTALAPPPYVALVSVDSRGSEATRDLGREAVQVAAENRGLARVQDGHVALLLHGSDAAAAADRLARRLVEAGGDQATVGAVGPTDALVEAAAGLPRALTCARMLQVIGRQGTGATPEQLGIYTLLFSEAGRDGIEGFVGEAIGPLLEDDAARGGRLVETLTAYYDHGGQPKKVAEQLFVHVNTLYQRLERVDRLLGPEWRRGDRSLQVHLGLRLARLLRDV